MGDCVEQLTFLLFLKMADEQTRPPFNKPSTIPKGYDWPGDSRRNSAITHSAGCANPITAAGSCLKTGGSSLPELESKPGFRGTFSGFAVVSFRVSVKVIVKCILHDSEAVRNC